MNQGSPINKFDKHNKYSTMWRVLLFNTFNLNFNIRILNGKQSNKKFKLNYSGISLGISAKERYKRDSAITGTSLQLKNEKNAKKKQEKITYWVKNSRNLTKKQKNLHFYRLKHRAKRSGKKD